MKGFLMIFGGSAAYDSKRRQKLACREVYTIEPAVPSFLRWSESAITFDRTDHPESVPQPGRYLLVVDPIIGTKQLTKVLMDGPRAHVPMNLAFTPFAPLSKHIERIKFNEGYISL